jgi:diguanylate cyclase (GGDEF)-like protein
MNTSNVSSWSTQQLTEMLALVSYLPDEADVVQRALEHAVESLEGDVGAVVSGGAVSAVIGYAMGSAPEQDLVAAARGELTVLDVPGAGPCRVFVVDCQGLPDGRMLIGQRLPNEYDSQERNLFRSFARVLGLALQAHRALQHERQLRLLSEQDAERRKQLVEVLRERQALLERLAFIQRLISTRRPLREVLDAIVLGVSELIGVEVAALRIIDPNDPTGLVLVASTGLSPRAQEKMRRSSVDTGAIGAAVRDRRPVVMDGDADDQLSPVMRDNGVVSAMVAPALQGDQVVGTLAVGTRSPGRKFSDGDQEVLVAFAEHAALALHDAQTVAALKEAVSEATRRAHQDALTGLSNRVAFLENVNAALGEPGPMSLQFIDLDDFKIVNDTLGHPVGDELLRVVGERIVGSVRTGDAVARLGGDEFAVLLWSSSADQAEIAAERIREALGEPYHLQGHVVSIGASTGLVHRTTEGPHVAEELLRDADVAMYRAKALGKGRTVVFADSMRAELQARSKLERELRRAIDAHQLVLYYQPIIDIPMSRVVGSEALLRWEHPELGTLPPSDFIAVAEETALIQAIGRQVLLDACEQTARWNDARPEQPWTVSVNVSASQLVDGRVVEHVREALSSSGLAPHHLTLELTESVLVHDIESAAGILFDLKWLGVRLAIDDFGTRYSSLSYLARLPVDVLKVDRMFVEDAPTGTSHARLAASVVALARSLQLETVVEGVESSQQLGIMLRLGCRRFQGYRWSGPVPGAKFVETAASIERQLAVPWQRQAAFLRRTAHSGVTDG